MKHLVTAASLTALLVSASAAPAADTVVWYPSVVNTEGLGGAKYYSVLSVWNPAATEITLTVDGFVSNTSGLSAPTATVTATVPAATHATIPNVLAALFGGLEGLAAARITASGPATFFHSVVNDQTAAGNGQTLLKVDNARGENVLSGGSLLQLANASAEDRAMGKGKRTNVGYFNPSFDTKTVTFRAWTSNATLIGEEVRSIPAWSQVQQPVFDLVPPTTAGNTVHDDFLVTFEVQGGGLLVYSTVVDNKTNDGVYQAAQ
ncbi:MAG: hypothetical protein IPN03_11130 [Holophagales bacterium]|nr:hypothetical protein [Holophagales bacterium]